MDESCQSFVPCDSAFCGRWPNVGKSTVRMMLDMHVHCEDECSLGFRDPGVPASAQW